MKSFVIILLIISFYGKGYAQLAPPFWSDIVAFKKKDSASLPPAQAILFIGSSSFTRWNDIHSYFPGYDIINRGFGGSSLPDVIRYAYDIILPYAPRQVVIYCGENDLATADSLSASGVVMRFKTLFGIIRQNLPAATIDFVSMKPSPVRAGIQAKIIAANKAIRKFLKRKPNARFIDIYPAMLDGQGNMRDELYVEDKLHMKPDGYLIWQKIIHPYLINRQH